MKAQAIPGVFGFQKVHGMTMTPTWRSWREMLARCNNPNNDRYADYGGRGIKVCAAWLEFRNFFADMGERPPKKTLDRKENGGDYTPKNCRWATAEEQQQNSRQTKLWEINGAIYKGLGEASRQLGIHRATLQWRFNHHVSGYRVLS